MIVEINEMRIRAGEEAEFERLYFAQRRTAEDGRSAPRSSRLYRRIDRPNEYAVVLEWETVEADVRAESSQEARNARTALFELVDERTRKARFEEIERA